MEWDGEERRKHRELSDDEIARIAERVFSIVYEQAGRSAVKVLLHVLWMGGIAAIAWLAAKGGLK